MAVLDDDAFVARDGTGECSSTTMPCASCLPTVHRHGSRPSYHQLLGAAMLHPDGREVMPRMPAPMVQHDGTATNDGARQAATRCMSKRRQDHPHRKGMIT